MKRPRKPPPVRVKPAAGDIVVTKVSRHYHIGRVEADGEMIAAIEVINDRAEAIARACRLIAGQQRVFLYPDAGSPDRVQIYCATPR
jgi:hypothetical protein